ncbi:MAG: single-stranded DNA-binding protein [Campylobacteraceae bacterium]|nr:single-stranded DNA-binding protein [Campylobacteraceae bacterium]
MYNKVVMVGNLTRDVELRYLPSGAAIAKSAIATSYKYKTATGEQKDEVCFLDFNIFGRSAEVANQYLRKGSKVLLEGRLVFEQWTAQDGTNRNRHSLRVDVMKMLDSKADSQSQSGGEYQPSTQQQPAAQQQSQQPQQQYNNSYNNQQQGYQSQGQVQEQKIPEINIDEDEIPF